MKISFDADVAPPVMQGAMGIMIFALQTERPLSDLERLGWLVLCKYIVARLSDKGGQPMNESSSTAFQCSDCGKVMPQDMSHRCTATAGALPGTGFIDGIGTVRACIDCGVLVAGGPTRCMDCAQKVAPKFTVEYDPAIGCAPSPLWMALRDLPPGAIFETEEGTQAVKSEYLLNPENPLSDCMCIIIGSGEFFHGQYHDDTVVKQIG